jgi:hypothetical protein
MIGESADSAAPAKISNDSAAERDAAAPEARASPLQQQGSAEPIARESRDEAALALAALAGSAPLGAAASAGPTEVECCSDDESQPDAAAASDPPLKRQRSAPKWRELEPAGKAQKQDGKRDGKRAAAAQSSGRIEPEVFVPPATLQATLDAITQAQKTWMQQRLPVSMISSGWVVLPEGTSSNTSSYDEGHYMYVYGRPAGQAKKGKKGAPAFKTNRQKVYDWWEQSLADGSAKAAPLRAPVRDASGLVVSAGGLRLWLMPSSRAGTRRGASGTGYRGVTAQPVGGRTLFVAKWGAAYLGAGVAAEEAAFHLARHLRDEGATLAEDDDQAQDPAAVLAAAKAAAPAAAKRHRPTATTVKPEGPPRPLPPPPRPLPPPPPVVAAEETCSWVECSRCGKWRRVDAAVAAGIGSCRWFCEQARRSVARPSPRPAAPISRLRFLGVLRFTSRRRTPTRASPRATCPRHAATRRIPAWRLPQRPRRAVHARAGRWRRWRRCQCARPLAQAVLRSPRPPSTFSRAIRSR